jgi:hypothetical protein
VSAILDYLCRYMALTSYLTAMLTPDEFLAIHTMTSLASLSADHRALVTHYQDWFGVLREAGFLELDFTKTRPSGKSRQPRLRPDRALREVRTRLETIGPVEVLGGPAMEADDATHLPSHDRPAFTSSGR